MGKCCKGVCVDRINPGMNAGARAMQKKAYRGLFAWRCKKTKPQPREVARRRGRV